MANCIKETHLITDHDNHILTTRDETDDAAETIMNNESTNLINKFKTPRSPPETDQGC